MSANHPLVTKLLQKKAQVQSEFEKRHEFAQKWLEERGLSLDQIREHSAKLLTGATLSSALLLASPHIPQALGQPHFHKPVLTIQEFLLKLKTVQEANTTKEIEEEIVENIQNLYGVRTTFELDQNRLPTYFGKMGLEQHLVRYSGDSLENHQAFLQAGVAPGRGAFGYFSENGELDPEAAERERFYIVLQTFVIPDWNKDWVKLKKWYKFRKFLVINPKTGRGVVAVLGDSGPATWTGKVFGGSPEVMAGLDFYPKVTRGDVLVLFLDDPENNIPLGPLFMKGVYQ